ncbi:MAG: hypothetical protein IJT62_08370 [Oscillospiraceae bacterium]|nr:hypothetical protein [Oscillospiraceae bacterium]
MEDRSLFLERKTIINNAFACRKNTRVPIFSNFWTWKMLDSEYSLRETLENYDILFRVVCDFQERYQFDSLFDLGTRNPVRVTKALGDNEFHKIDDATESIYVLDHEIMSEDDYDLFIKDKTEFYWTKAFARYCPDLTIGQLDNAIREYRDFQKFSAGIAKKFVEDYQCVPAPINYLKQPFEYFFTSLRGMKGCALDLRRKKDKVIEACRHIYETMTLPLLKRVIQQDNSGFMCDMYTAFLGHSILNTKQFGDIYWPVLKGCMDMFEQNGKQLLIQSESTLLRFADFFKDVPVGLLAIEIEQDDIFEMRKALPQICFLGGMPTYLLGRGTPEQCVDYTKKLIDGMGNGFILSQDKMISYRKDCKRENLLASNNFAREYKL